MHLEGGTSKPWYTRSSFHAFGMSSLSLQHRKGEGKCLGQVIQTEGSAGVIWRLLRLRPRGACPFSSPECTNLSRTLASRQPKDCVSGLCATFTQLPRGPGGQVLSFLSYHTSEWQSCSHNDLVEWLQPCQAHPSLHLRCSMDGNWHSLPCVRI